MDNTLEHTHEADEAPRKGGLNAISIAVIVGLVLFIALVGAQLAQQTAPANIGIGSPAPDFALTTFEGEDMSRESLLGNVVVVNFWASWCVPCHDEAPVLQDIWEQYQDENFVMLGVTHSDVARDSREFMAQYTITYPNAPDPGAHIYDRYGLTGVPETFVIAPDGTLAFIVRGPLTEANTPEFLAKIDELVGET